MLGLALGSKLGIPVVTMVLTIGALLLVVARGDVAGAPSASGSQNSSISGNVIDRRAGRRPHGVILSRGIYAELFGSDGGTVSAIKSSI